MRFSPTALILGLLATVVKDVCAQSCAADQCPCKSGCEPFGNGETCCPQTGQFDGHICGPKLQCCGNGCCPEGWTCSGDNMCYPLNTVTESDVTITTMLTVTKCPPSSSLAVTDSTTTIVTTDANGRTTTIATIIPTTTTVVTSNTILPSSTTTTFVTTNTAGQPTTVTTVMTSTNQPILTQSITTTMITTGSDGKPTTMTTVLMTTEQPTSTATTTTIVTTDSVGKPTTLTTVMMTTVQPTSTLVTSIIVTTNSVGQATTLTTVMMTTIQPTPPPSTSTIVTTNSNGQSTTMISLITPPAQPTSTSIMATAPGGQPTTIFVPPGQIPSTISLPPTITTFPGGQVSTVFPVPCFFSTQVPRPYVGTGLDGAVTTFFPQLCTETSSVTSLVTTLPGGQSTTIFVPPGQTPSTISLPPTITTFPGGQTSTVFPVPCFLTTEIPVPYVGTGLDGQVTTFYPLLCTDAASTTSIVTTIPNGQSTTLFIPPGETPSTITQPPTITTFPDGHTETIFPVPCFEVGRLPIPYVGTGLDGRLTTFFPSYCPPASTTSSAASSTTTHHPYLIPVTTGVDQPKPTDDGVVFPCSFWFFNICITWGELHINGWHLISPPGIYPPGPPPPFSFDPSADFTVGITGTLPEWPEYTIGTDFQPTFSPSPSNCETQTAEMCITSTFYAVSVSSTVTETTDEVETSTCATVFGCKVTDTATEVTTATTETATPTPLLQVVYPMNGKDQVQVASIQSKLMDIAKDQSKIYAPKYDDFGTLFWRLSMTQSDAEDVRKITGVASVIESCDNDLYPCYDPTISLVYQPNAPAHLTYVSWPNTTPRTPFANLLDTYYFDDSAGEDVPVYVIDTGATIENPEFDDIRDKTEWLWPVADSDGGRPMDDSNLNPANISERHKFHGTSMLSMVAGKNVGVAKKVKPYVVRLPRREPGQGFSVEDWYETAAAAAAAMPRKLDGTTAGVVCLAHYWPMEAVSRKTGKGTYDNLLVNGALDGWQGFETGLRQVIQTMMDKGYIIHTGGGNSGIDIIDGWPASYGKNNDAFPNSPFLVMGGVTPQEPDPENGKIIGSVAHDTGLPHVYAPALANVANGAAVNWITNGYLKISSGNSIATSITTGLTATFVRLAQLGQLKNDDGSLVPNTPLDIRNYVLSKAWSRGPLKDGTWSSFKGTLERKAIWNGADSTKQGSCLWNPNPVPAPAPAPAPRKLRRQAGGQCKPPLTISGSSTSTSMSSTTTVPTTTLLTTTTSTTATTATSNTAAPTPANPWRLTLYKNKCEEETTDYYSFEGYGLQGLNELCINLKDPNLPFSSPNSVSCSFWKNGGTGEGTANRVKCSEATFDNPQSFVIKNGFCTPFGDVTCPNGLVGGIDSKINSQCFDYTNDIGISATWAGMKCFAYGS